MSLKFSNPKISPSEVKFEVNTWIISEFVVKTLVPIVEFAPYPLEELCLMTAAVCFLEPDYIFEWGTHLGKSARIFYEIKKAFSLGTKIVSIDLPASANHSENLSFQRGLLVKDIPEVKLVEGEGLKDSLIMARNIPNRGKLLFFLDGDHSYESVDRELKTIARSLPTASFLVHDTVFLGKLSGCDNGPYRAVASLLRKNSKSYLRIATCSGRPGLTFLLKI